MYFNDDYTEWPPNPRLPSITCRYPTTLFRLEVQLMAAVLRLVSSQGLAPASQALAAAVRSFRDWLGGFALSYMKLGFVYPAPKSISGFGRPYESVPITPLFFALPHDLIGGTPSPSSHGGIYCPHLQVWAFRDESEALTLRRRLVGIWGDEGDLAAPESISELFRALETPGEAKRIRAALNDDHHLTLITVLPLDPLYSWADQPGSSEPLSVNNFVGNADLLLDMVTRTPNDWRVRLDWRLRPSARSGGEGLVGRTILPSLRDALWAMLLGDANGLGLWPCEAGQRCLGMGYFTRGRANRRYCSTKCRKAAFRARH
jgi:hypothetical protein